MVDATLSSHRQSSASFRDIRSPREVYDDERRAAADDSLRLFLESYFPAAFPLAWSADHLRVIDIMERVATSAGLFTLAMPRGSGKTSLAVRAALWALLTGRRQYVEVIASTERAAQKIIKTMRSELSFNDQLRLDYPAELHGIWQLQGDNRRSGGQLCNGKKTGVMLGVAEIIFPTHEFSKIGGSVVYAAGLTGNVRGPNHTRMDGSVIRPDFVVLDDPQTRESATSGPQTQERSEIIEGDVLGLAGPGKTIAAVMPCTVIARDDLAERFLKNPRWTGIRAKMLDSFPSDLKLWDEYFELRAESMRVEGNQESSNRFYESHRAAMDAGAAASWEARHEPGELSAIQSAMHLWYRSPTAFAAEYQNEPLDESANSDAPRFAGLENKLTQLDRGIVPSWATKVTVGIDVQERVLFYLVAAWADDFTGSVIQYGAFPDQTRAYYTYSEANPTLQSQSGMSQPEPSVFWGVDKLTEAMALKRWQRNGGGEMPTDRIFVDSGYLSETIYEVCRRSKFPSVVMPSKGYGIQAGKVPMDRWPKRPGETHGQFMVARQSQTGRAIRHTLIDTNSWKEFMAARVTAATGEKGSLSIYGTKPEQHRLLADHLAAESPTQTFGQGRRVWEWTCRPGVDNHLLDCLVLAGAGAAACGVFLGSLPSNMPNQRKSVKFSEEQKKKRGGDGRRD